MNEILRGDVSIHGRVRAFRVQHHAFNPCRSLVDGISLPGLWRSVTPWRHNDVMYDWGAAVTRVLTSVSAQNYRLSGMYLEYKNVANPADVISPPGVTRSGARAYYDSLVSSPDTDYLRVPLITTSLDNSDPNTFDDVNRMTFFAMSQGVVGVNGKAFSDTANSKVYGGAIVAMVDLGDYTQDVIFSRFYLPENEQQVKLATSMVGLEWALTLV